MTVLSIAYAALFYAATAILVVGVALKIRGYARTPAPLLIPTTPAPTTSGGVALHRLHHRAEPGDGAGPEVIAVAEPARQDDDIRALQIGVAVPHEVGPGTHGLRGAECVEVAVAAGEPHHRDIEHQLSSTWSR